MKKVKKTLLTLVCAGALVVGSVAATMAYLTDTTETVTNTFTVGDIELTLEETTGPNYKVTPGADIKKDPVVTVEEGSETSWVFLEVDDDLNSGLSWNLAEDWIPLEGVSGVYYRGPVDASTGDVTFQVIAGDTVTVSEDIDGSVSELGELAFTAYAVQYAGFESDIAAAWAAAQGA